MVLRLVTVFSLLPLFVQLAFAAKERKPKDDIEKFFMQAEASDVRITPGNRGLSYIGFKGGKTVLKRYDFESGVTRAIEAKFQDQHRQAVLDPDKPLNLNVYDYYWIDRETALAYSHNLGRPMYIFLTNYRLTKNDPFDYYKTYDLMPDTPNLFLAKEDGKKGEKFPDLHRVNTKTRSSKLVAKNPGHIILWFTDKDGAPRIRHYVDENEKDRFEYKESDDADWRPINLEGDSYGVLFLKDDENILFFHRPDGAPRVIGRYYNIEKEEFFGDIIEDPVFDIIPTEYIVDPETEETLGFVYEHLTTSKSFWFDETLKSAHERLINDNPDFDIRILGFADTKSKIVFQKSNDRHPPEWSIWDTDSNDIEIVAKELPWIDPSEMCEVRPIEVPSSDGVSIHGYMTLPKDQNKPSKAIAMVHGGPRARDYWGWDREAQYFASQGYVVLKINYRGSEGYGTDYSPLYHLDAIKNSVNDVADSVKWAIKEGFVDPDRVAIYGSSFGGHVALVSAAKYPDLYACSAGYAGVYNWVKEFDREFKEEPIYYKLKMNTYYGDYENEKEIWLAESAEPMVDKIDIPILLIHGRSDEVVASSQSRRLHKLLRKAKKDVKLKLLSFNRHGLLMEKQTIQFYRDLTKFVESHVGD